MLSLDGDEVRAAYHAVAEFRRARALAGRPCPPQLEQLYRRLDTAYRVPLSPTRHESHCLAGKSNAWLGTQLVSDMLGWNLRRVQRHAADLDGQLVSGRLVFPAASVEAYRKALQQRGNHK